MRNLRGKFIVFDGGEGCGKSTQSQLLQSALAHAGTPTTLVRDPGSTRLGEMIRQMLLDPANTEMNMRTEMLLYMAARAQMMREIILPALSAGSCVICDRFVSSTLAYQLDGDGLTADEILSVAAVAIHGRWPDLTLILDMPVEKCNERIQRERDRIEQRPMQYHQRVRENYLRFAMDHPKRACSIDAARDRDSVHRDVMAAVSQLGES